MKTLPYDCPGQNSWDLRFYITITNHPGVFSWKCTVFLHIQWASHVFSHVDMFTILMAGQMQVPALCQFKINQEMDIGLQCFTQFESELEVVNVACDGMVCDGVVQ